MTGDTAVAEPQRWRRPRRRKAEPACVLVYGLFGGVAHERRYGKDVVSRHRPQDCHTPPPAVCG